MAFTDDEGETGDALEAIQDRMAKMSNVAETRDQLYAASESKPIQIAIGAAIGLWAIYHFLIKR